VHPAHYGFLTIMRYTNPLTQRVFLRAKPKAAYVRASTPQPGGAVEQSISLCANMTSSTKQEIRNVPSEEDRATAIGNMQKKLVKIAWTCSSGDMIEDRQKTHTQGQTDTLITYSALPYQGGVIILSQHRHQEPSRCQAMLTKATVP